MRHKGIVVRARSAYKRTLIILDQHLGKVECLGAYDQSFSHGALLEYTIHKKGIRYMVKDVKLHSVPLEWARDNVMFFHHVLELCNAFIPWDSHCEGTFRLLSLLYTHPEKITSPGAQQQFLSAFFQQVGVHPEPGQYTTQQWLEACINEYPGVLKTAGFLKELHEELA